MNISRLYRGALTLALASTSIGAFADTSTAAIYDPSAHFLKRKVDFSTAVDAANANRTYYKKVLVESGYVIPTNPNDPASVDAAIAPFTLAQWKQKNGFNATGAVTAGAKYYNGVDLGLGRNMNCVNQDGNAVANRLKGMACYVSSHGKIGGTMRDGLAAVNAANSQSFAAVAMEYRPNATENKVRFFVFGEGGDNGTILYPQGTSTDNAFYQFDTGRGLPMAGQTTSGQPVPGVCLSCHGGTLDAGTGTITEAHFLPFDTFSLDFATLTDRNKATLEFNKLNTWVYRAELLANPYSTAPTSQLQIIDFLKGSYLPAPGTAAGSEIAATAVMNDDYVDARFAPAGSISEIVSAYKSVARPYCRGCHMAQTVELKPINLKVACNPSNEMPHSETASHNLYRHGDFVQPVINRIPTIASSTSCKSIFKLMDFDGLYPLHNTLFFAGGDVAAGQTTALLESDKTSKRTLGNSKWGTFWAIQSDQDNSYQQQVKSLSFEYVMDSVDRMDAFGNTQWLDAGNTNSNPSVPHTPFRIHTFMGPTAIGSVYIDHSLSRMPGLQEVDNVLAEYTLNELGNTKQADFEDKTYGALGTPTMSLVSSNSECSGFRVNNKLSIIPFEISQRIKLSDDSGRYALSTGGLLCANEVATISFKLTGVPATNKVASLRFNYETFGGTDGKGIAQLTYTTATGTVTKNLHELTYEHLDSNIGAAGGNVTIEVPVDTTFSISFKPSSGTKDIPSKGLVVDNINVVTYVLNNVIPNCKSASNLVPNCSFDIPTATNWSLTAYNGANASVNYSGNQMLTSIGNAGSEFWHVQARTAVNVAAGTYTLRFSAKAASARSVQINLGHNGGTWQSYSQQTVNLTSTMQTFTLTLPNIPTDTNSVLDFNLGKTGTSAVTLDEVSLVKNP